MKTKLRYWWRFKEQDGSWTQWYECSEAEYDKFKHDPDCDVMVLGSE